MKKHIPDNVKNSIEYQQINILRTLVNCFKHAGIVNKELHRLEPAFGNIGDEITGDLAALYDRYKIHTVSVINKVYKHYET